MSNLINLQHLYFCLSGSVVVFHDLETGFLWAYNGLSRITAIDASGRIVYQEEHSDIAALALSITKSQGLARTRIDELRKEGEL